jgi:glucosamine--fructose-6-phosphate aminotransferase (isomerizing)
MCGIVGAIANRPVVDILIEGLRRLEYRGYDSAGVCVFEEGLQVHKAAGKVAEVAKLNEQQPLTGILGIAHTRWATHGGPSTPNAHPHLSNDQRFAVVHNGIIENYAELKGELLNDGFEFKSDTDTEVVANLLQTIDASKGLVERVQELTKKLTGAYAFGIVDEQDTDRLVCARAGSPLVIGLGFGENFIASDAMALHQVTDRFIYLEEGDIAEIRRHSIRIFDANGNEVERDMVQIQAADAGTDKGEYRHYMLKEIFEQARVAEDAIEGRLTNEGVLVESFGVQAPELFAKTQALHIVACGTSYHAGLVAKHWIEKHCNIPVLVEVASEYRYQHQVVLPGTLFVSISQSGETMDTLAALRNLKSENLIGSLTICNAPNSSLVRESDLVFMTKAGPEIGVASTKAFTAQLVALQMLTMALHQAKTGSVITGWADALTGLPQAIADVLATDESIAAMAEQFVDKHHALFLGRGVQHPVAMEGALKLKEISYIHAEAYAAGELKHGPLALVDADMPVIAVAPSDELLEKLASNLKEVSSRGGELYVVAEAGTDIDAEHRIDVPAVAESIAAIVYNIPLQLLSYHVAVMKGTDVDQPRNLAKSVTVE